jgi:hypothetical protein
MQGEQRLLKDVLDVVGVHRHPAAQIASQGARDTAQGFPIGRLVARLRAQPAILQTRPMIAPGAAHAHVVNVPHASGRSPHGAPA